MVSICVKLFQILPKRAHNPKVVGSNPAPATKKFKRLWNSAISAFLVF